MVTSKKDKERSYKTKRIMVLEVRKMELPIILITKNQRVKQIIQDKINMVRNKINK